MSPTARTFALLLAAFGLGAAMIFAAWQLTAPAVPEQKESPPALIGGVTAPKPVPTPAEIYAREVQPLLEPFDQRNAAALARAEEAVREHFEAYAAGIPNFTEDMVSYRTRYILARRMKDDWWEEDEADRVGVYVGRKVAKYVVSDERMRVDLEKAFARLRADLEAERNSLISGVNLVLTRDEVAAGLRLNSGEIAAVRSTFDRNFQEEFRGFAQDSLMSMILSEAGGALAGAAATLGVAAVGSAVTTTAGGAGAGLVGGPVGAAAGAAVGLVAGLLVDMWMSERLERKLADSVQKYLDELQGGLLNGVGSRPGLLAELRGIREAALASADSALRRAVLRTAE